jgi:hypothetical protein
MPRLAFIGSSGRTATTFIASVLNRIPGVLACHEGYPGSDKNSEPAVPLINLENRQAYLDSQSAIDTARNKRGAELLTRVLLDNKSKYFIDVAYYNSVLATALLELHSQAQFIGILRDCAGFVRSATCMHGEDLLPVGWADENKPLSAREKFIALGRILPQPDTREREQWDEMSAIEKNIWLWRETNLALIRAGEKFPKRFMLLKFGDIHEQGGFAFFTRIADHLGLDHEAMKQAVLTQGDEFRNAKTGGYQVDEPCSWTSREQRCLREAVDRVEQELANVE